MNAHSAAGTDRMNEKFFQSCQNILGQDLLQVVISFFCGHAIPKYFSYTCLILLPKVTQPNKLSEYRPISLSNFTNKVISKLIYLKLAPIFPTLISRNQSGFVKGRNITENFILALEIISGIKQPVVGGNIVIQLDMYKTYDSLSWSYTCLVLRRFRSGEIIIDMIWKTLLNSWYLVVVNGTKHGFFHSTRGLK